LQSQSIYLKDRIVQYQNSLPTTILQSINQAIKDIISYIYKLTLLQKEITILYTVNDLLSRHRRMKKRCIQEKEVVRVENIQDSEA